MSTTNPADVSTSSPAATNTWLSGLNWGSYWDSPSSSTATIHYYVAGNENISFGNLNSLTSFDTVDCDSALSTELTAIGLAMQLFENVANIDFVATSSISQADLVWGFSNGYPAGAYGVACPPGEFYNTAIGDYQGGVIVNYATYEGDDAGSGLVQGGFDFITIIHELGHALGLAHPHDGGGDSTQFPGVTSPFGDFGNFDMNQGIFTTMSYNDGWQSVLGSSGAATYGWQGTPMALDVAWMQAVYGANTSYNSGNNAYVLGPGSGSNMMSCIWDTGGKDTISYAGSYGCTIDLNAATLANAAGGGGYVSYIDGAPSTAGEHWDAFTIAAGVVIENATGGSGSDILNGNAAANVLTGGAGNDRLTGGGAADRLVGGGGRDNLIGGGGADTLIGGGGVDRMTGGSGADNFVFNAALAGNVDTITDFTANIDKIHLDNAIFAAFADGNLTKFTTGASASGSGAQVVYNSATGALSYDSDGAGGAAQQQFATVSSGLGLDAQDFYIV